MSADPSNSLAPLPPMIGGGEMGDLVRDTDWSSTALGDYRSWPASLRSALSLVLNTKGIAALYWGPQQWLLYNDAYGLALGDRHPARSVARCRRCSPTSPRCSVLKWHGCLPQAMVSP